MANKIYVSPDGSWGDATGLVIVEVSDDQMAKLSDLDGDDALEYLDRTDPMFKVM